MTAPEVEHGISDVSESDMYGTHVQCICGWSRSGGDLTELADELFDHIIEGGTE